MSSTQQVFAAGPPISVQGSRWPRGYGQLHGADLRWAIAFVLPYAAVFFVFVVYPFGYALWMAGRPALYAELIANRSYLTAVVNTLLFVGIGVNVKMFLALLLSGFFLRPRWWIKAALAVYVLPWLIAAAQACVSFHWMLQQEGLVNGVFSALFGFDGPIWFNDRWLGLGWNIAVYIWKWMPFWTLIFIAAPCGYPGTSMLRQKWMGQSGSAASFILPSRCWGTSTCSARCSRLSGPSATSRPSILSRAAGQPARRTCWRPSAFTTRLTKVTRRSASRRQCPRFRC